MRKIVCVTMITSSLFWSANAALAVEQPHMEATLHALEHALSEVEIADANRDHGGHAGAATHLIEEAIREIREGIRYRNEH